jgi:hypothetical protein
MSSASARHCSKTACITLCAQHMAQHIPSDARTALMQFGNRKIADHLIERLENQLRLHTAPIAKLPNLA